MNDFLMLVERCLYHGWSKTTIFLIFSVDYVREMLYKVFHHFDVPKDYCIVHQHGRKTIAHWYHSWTAWKLSPK